MIGERCRDEWKDRPRLRMISRCRSEILAKESQAAQESRLQRERERHGTLPLLEQPIVKSKMQNFHQHLSTLKF